MAFIRKYEPKDYENVRYCCLHSEQKQNPDKVNEFILQTYCNYYIENEPENCFVADDGTGRAVGYVICTSDYDKFKKVFYKQYMPRTLKLGINFYFDSMFSAWPQRRFRKKYPAHLHIDILPEYQRMGLGGKLVTALCEHLKANGVKGVMLTAGAKNEKGNSFYKKYGFHEIEKNKGYVAWGLRFE